MKVLLRFIVFGFLTLLLSAVSKKDSPHYVSSKTDQEIVVKNEITFEPYTEYADQQTYPSIQFKVIVINNGNKSIPDLGVSNRSKYLNFMINDTINNPVSLYNGLEATDSPKIIKAKQCDEYSLRWVLSPDAGIVKFYGNEILIQWKYMDVYSNKMKINISEESVQLID